MTRSGQPARRHPPDHLAAGLGPTLALTATLAIATFTLLMSGVVLISRPGTYLDVLIKLGTPEQNQSAKTLLYVVAFVGIVPLAIVFVPRVADRIASGPNARALPALAAALAATLAAAIIIARLSKRLPWGTAWPSSSPARPPGGYWPAPCWPGPRGRGLGRC